MKLKRVRKIVKECPLEIEIKDDKDKSLIYKFSSHVRKQILREVFSSNIFLKYFPFINKIQVKYKKYIFQMAQKELEDFLFRKEMILKIIKDKMQKEEYRRFINNEGDYSFYEFDADLRKNPNKLFFIIMFLVGRKSIDLKELKTFIKGY